MNRFIVLLLFLIVGTVAFQGFQCESVQMTSGKLAYQKKEYQKAEDYFEQEIKQNPSNGEARVLLVETRYSMGKIDAAIETIIESRDQIEQPMIKRNLQIINNKIWTEAYKSGLNNLDKFYQLNNAGAGEAATKFADSAVVHFKRGAKLMPEYIDFHFYLGEAYLGINEENKAIESFKTYIKKLDDEIQYAENNGFHLNMKREEILTKLGNPSNTVSATRGEDSVITDSYVDDGKDVFLHYGYEDTEFKLKGWVYDPPSFWIENVRSVWRSITTSPISQLASLYVDKENYSETLDMIDFWLKLNPNDQEAIQAQAQVLDISGQSDMAKKKLEEKIEKNPNNERLLLLYADMLQKDENYDKAIDYYKQVLKIDPQNPFALNNAASAYKNHAGKIQSQEAEKQESDKAYVQDTSRYFPLLRKSAELFDRANNTNEFKNNYSILGELGNIWYVLDSKEKLEATIRELEALEFKVPKNEKENYYYMMLKFYSDMKKSDKVQEIKEKIDKL